MFLKHYTGLSDAKLIERVNTDWHFQCFCGLAPRIHYGIKDKDMVGRWRRFFGSDLNINALQEKLAEAWKEDLAHQQISMQDAMVYESYIKHPTDLKLLWDCLKWLRAQMDKVGKLTQSALPRSKYEARLKRYIAFCKRRKKPHKLEPVPMPSKLPRLDNKKSKTLNALLKQVPYSEKLDHSAGFFFQTVPNTEIKLKRRIIANGQDNKLYRQN